MEMLKRLLRALHEGERQHDEHNPGSPLLGGTDKVEQAIEGLGNPAT